MISYRQADLLEYRKKVRIRFYLMVNHAPDENPTERKSMLSIYNVSDIDKVESNKFSVSPRRVELAMAFEIFDDYMRSLGVDDVGKHIWHGDYDWRNDVEKFENYLRSRPEISDVEFNLLPNQIKPSKYADTSKFNDTYECYFNIYSTLVPKGIE